jgi:hypothetical protein
MMSDFAEEEGDQKLQALRSLGPRGLGLGVPRLTARLGDLKEAFGSAPKASEWFRRVRITAISGNRSCLRRMHSLSNSPSGATFWAAGAAEDRFGRYFLALSVAGGSKIRN